MTFSGRGTNNEISFESREPSVSEQRIGQREDARQRYTALVPEGYNFVVVRTGASFSRRRSIEIEWRRQHRNIVFYRDKERWVFSDDLVLHDGTSNISFLPFHGPMIRPVGFHRRLRPTHATFTREKQLSRVIRPP